jgi:hypothetical protein
MLKITSSENSELRKVGSPYYDPKFEHTVYEITSTGRIEHKLVEPVWKFPIAEKVGEKGSKKLVYTGELYVIPCNQSLNVALQGDLTIEFKTCIGGHVSVQGLYVEKSIIDEEKKRKRLEAETTNKKKKQNKIEFIPIVVTIDAPLQVEEVILHQGPPDVQSLIVGQPQEPIQDIPTPQGSTTQVEVPQVESPLHEDIIEEDDEEYYDDDDVTDTLFAPYPDSTDWLIFPPIKKYFHFRKTSVS